MNRLDQLQTLDPEVLQNFLETKISHAISKELQDYIIKINAVPSIIHYNGASVSKATKLLMQQFRGLTYSEARSIYYDALNFFYIDDNVSSDAWDNYYAEKIEDLARYSIGVNRPDVALKAFLEAHRLKVRNSDRIKPGDWKPPVFIINNKIKPEDLGYEKQSIYEINRKAESGFYAKLISSLPTSEKQKASLRQDAGVEDVDYEEPSEEPDGE